MARHFKDWIEAYLKYTQFSESPDRFHFWTAVSTIAGTLRGKVWLDMGYFEWSPNFFVFLVAPAGITSKSTSANIGVGLLRDVKGVKIGPTSLTWQGLIVALQNAAELYPMEDDPLGERLEMSALTISASELGTLFDPNNREMVDVLVDLWDGKKIPWTRFTKGDGEKQVINPWINIIACTTPSWIADNFTNNFIGGGFSSRCVFVFAESKRQLVAYPRKHFPLDIKAQQEKLLADLQEMASMRGAYTLTKEAEDWGEAWYHELYHNPPEIGIGDRFQGYIARKQTHLHKLAMVLSASTRGDLKIAVDDFIRAEKILTETENEMPRVFLQMNREQATEFSADILDIVRKGKIEREVLYRVHFFRRIGYQTFDQVLTSALNSKIVQQTVDRSGNVWIEPNEELLQATITRRLADNSSPSGSPAPNSRSGTS